MSPVFSVMYVYVYVRMWCINNCRDAINFYDGYHPVLD